MTLVELLVGLAVGSIVLTGVVMAWGISMRSAAYTFEAARLNHDLRATMQIVTQDLRRADGESVRFTDDGNCVTFSVAPPASKRGAGGICETAPATDSECWSARGYRQNEDRFEMFFSTDPSAVASCDSGADEWIPLYDDLAAGTFRVNNFEALCLPGSRCIDLATEAESVPGDCSAYPRCATAEYIEILAVNLEMTATISVGGNEKQLTLREVVAVRNNDRQ
ncbi:MAG TPA: hypothetical protein PLN31_18495 [Azoarcus taiwanensis]|nr:hypothetical protein [Azoarcus taiwanensis]